MNSARLRFALSILPLVLVSGCVWFAIPDPGPPPEAVLAGTWQVITGNESDITELLWVFDENGNLVENRYKVPTLVGEATTTEHDPADETTVDGSAVTVRIPFAINYFFLFEGTLNQAQDRVEGQISINYDNPVFDTTISIDRGAASMVKQ